MNTNQIVNSLVAEYADLNRETNHFAHSANTLNAMVSKKVAIQQSLAEHGLNTEGAPLFNNDAEQEDWDSF